MPEMYCQVVSLLEMLRIYSAGFVAIGQLIQEIRSKHSDGAIIPDQHRNELLTQINRLIEACKNMGLDVSSEVLARYHEEMQEDHELTYSRLALRVSHWETTFFAELSKQTFFQLSARETSYFSDGEMVGIEIKESLQALGEFKDAAFDIMEAGRCMSLDRPTAAVYHLMRAAEYGLVAVAASIGVAPEKRTGWEAMIGGIHSEVNARVSRREPNCKEEEKKYDGLCAWFTTIKNGWRNPVSHVPISYSLNTAKGMFSAVRTLFEHLRKQRISPCPMPSETISLPDIL